LDGGILQTESRHQAGKDNDVVDEHETIAAMGSVAIAVQRFDPDVFGKDQK
jgi:hypothetical protein